MIKKYDFADCRNSITETRNAGLSDLSKKNQSELRQIITPDIFENVYRHFIEQADINAISGKSHGSQAPFGFPKKVELDGADFKQHFGQGAASKTPYVNWWVVSVYYLVDSGNIVMGIEENRYPYLKEMKPLKYEQIGNKNISVAVFYESTKDCVNYTELHEKFISVAEEIMNLGLK